MFIIMPICFRVIGCQHSPGCFVVFSWYDVIPCEKLPRHRCALLDVFSAIFLPLMFLNIQIDWIIYIKDIRPAIYFNNQKIVAYHL